MRTRIERAIQKVEIRLKTAKPNEILALKEVLQQLLTARQMMSNIDDYLTQMGE